MSRLIPASPLAGVREELLDYEHWIRQEMAQVDATLSYLVDRTQVAPATRSARRTGAMAQQVVESQPDAVWTAMQVESRLVAKGWSQHHPAGSDGSVNVVRVALNRLCDRGRIDRVAVGRFRSKDAP